MSDATFAMLFTIAVFAVVLCVRIDFLNGRVEQLERALAGIDALAAIEAVKGKP